MLQKLTSVFSPTLFFAAGFLFFFQFLTIRCVSKKENTIMGAYSGISLVTGGSAEHAELEATDNKEETKEVDTLLKKWTIKPQPAAIVAFLALIGGFVSALLRKRYVSFALAMVGVAALGMLNWQFPDFVTFMQTAFVEQPTAEDLKDMIEYSIVWEWPFYTAAGLLALGGLLQLIPPRATPPVNI